MFPGQASQTLLIASIMRARHQLFDVPVILDDPVVLKLVPEARDAGVLTEFGELQSADCDLNAQHVRGAQQVYGGSVGTGSVARNPSICHVRCWSRYLPVAAA